MSPKNDVISWVLRQAGLAALDDGTFYGDLRRWQPHVVEAPQSWQRVLIPLLAQAILEARALSLPAGVDGLPILVAPRLTDSVVAKLRSFVAGVAPGQPWACVDRHSRGWLRLDPSEEEGRWVGPEEVVLYIAPKPPVNLFSDLNQWMLKVLLARRLESRLIHAPRMPIRNASELAEVARVSLAAASRLVHRLEAEQLLVRTGRELRLVAPLRLLERWRGSVDRVRTEVPAHFVRGALDEDGFRNVLSRLSEGDDAAAGLFSACELLGLGHVRGAPRHVYLMDLDPKRLAGLGLVHASAAERVDLTVCVPRFPASTFRGASLVNGIRTTDVIQCWLDVSFHPARGEEQAEYLWRKVFVPALSDP